MILSFFLLCLSTGHSFVTKTSAVTFHPFLSTSSSTTSSSKYQKETRSTTPTSKWKQGSAVPFLFRGLNRASCTRQFSSAAAAVENSTIVFDSLESKNLADNHEFIKPDRDFQESTFGYFSVPRNYSITNTRMLVKKQGNLQSKYFKTKTYINKTHQHVFMKMS